MKHLMFRRALSLALAGVLLTSLLAGCASPAPSGSASSASGEAAQMAAVSADTFDGYDLTLVNVFATWCNPCVRELPELQKLNDSMADRGVQVVGIVMDGVDQNGEADPNGVQKAWNLAETTGVSYPFLLPDFQLFDGRLADVSAVPETFFVDQNGNVVGETYVGARDLDSWTAIVEAELAALEGKQ